MFQYLVILLDDTSTSYCHYENKSSMRNLIPFDILQKGILFGMKENLMIQFVFPDYELPQEYKDEIESIDHSKIVPATTPVMDADVLVFNDIAMLTSFGIINSYSVVLRVTKEQIFEHATEIANILPKVLRLNLVITNIESFNDEDYTRYMEVLSEWSETLFSVYAKGEQPQFNILTDRILLNSMNNCRAGDNSITLAPDGRFYVCPAFYHVNEDEKYGLGKSKFNIGSLKNGLNIKNQQLFELEFAPICRECDAFHCKRCVWMNRKLTYEVNTPGKQQCVLSHIERNASRDLLQRIQTELKLMSSKSIKTIDYLDPFEKITELI